MGHLCIRTRTRVCRSILRRDNGLMRNYGYMIPRPGITTVFANCCLCFCGCLFAVVGE